MKVLVIGGAGYIGSVVAEELLSQGYAVVVFDNLKQGHREAVPPEAEFVEGDLADMRRLDDTFRHYGMDAVIHMAAETVVEASMTDPKKYFQNNVVNGMNLLEVMLRYRVNKIIFSSTAAVYGEPVEIPIPETHPQAPVNSYGESKLMFEKILDWYHRAYGMRSISLRYFNAAGASKRLGEDHRPETHLIPLVLQKALNPSGRELRIFGTDYPTRDGTCVRDYIHVIDLAQAHILGLRRLAELAPKETKGLSGLGSKIYNLGNGDGYSVIEVIETARKVTGVDIPAVPSERRKGDPAVLVASSEKIKAELGWKPKYPELETILRSGWEWHRRHPKGYRR